MARRVHTPSWFHRHPWSCTSFATESVGTPSSRAATSAAFFVGVTILVARPSACAAAIATPSIVVLPAPAAPSTTTSGSPEATAAAQAEGRATRIVTPTKKAADVAARELGVPTDSVAKLVHDHGWRWNQDGVWTRLAVGEADPRTGATYTGPPASARLRHGERVVVDEAGMLDQDTAVALLQIADEAGASLALVGDRAQLPAVGRGCLLYTSDAADE